MSVCLQRVEAPQGLHVRQATLSFVVEVKKGERTLRGGRIFARPLPASEAMLLPVLPPPPPSSQPFVCV